jgi:hypothetical protein
VDLAQEDLDQEEKMVKELKAQVGTHRTVKWNKMINASANVRLRYSLCETPKGVSNFLFSGDSILRRALLGDIEHIHWQSGWCVCGCQVRKVLHHLYFSNCYVAMGM